MRGWKVKANGINAYRGVHGAAWLGQIKLPSTLLEIIGRLWGRQDAERMALIEYELSPACNSWHAATHAASTAPIRCATWWPTRDLAAAHPAPETRAAICRVHHGNSRQRAPDNACACRLTSFHNRLRQAPNSRLTMASDIGNPIF